jgi:hypothetical protein
MDGLKTHFQQSKLLLSPSRSQHRQTAQKSQSSQSIPLQAPMRGKRCARRYMQTLPCTSPNSTFIYRRNCREHFNGRTSRCAVRRGCLPPSTRRILAYTKKCYNHACPPQDQRRGPRNDANLGRIRILVCTVCMSMRSIISLRHFAPVVCMNFLGHPDCWFTSHARTGDFER